MRTQYITVEQLMEILNVSRSTLYLWRKKGLPSKKIGRSIRFDYNEVKNWIDNLNSDREEK